MADDIVTDETPPSEPPDATPEGGDDDLGDGGKKALAAERAAARAADKRAKAAEAELAKLREANATESEKALAAAKAEGRNEALATANTRILTAEVKAAAAGVLQDPDDAVRLLDLDQFEVGEDGAVDVKAIKAEVAALAKAKPYLSVGATPAPLPGAGATPSQGISMDDLIRSKARGH
jgi:hypothetical protein